AEDALAEETVALGLERAVVDRLGLRYLAGRPVANLFARCESDPDRVEVIDVDQKLSFTEFQAAQTPAACGPLRCWLLNRTDTAVLIPRPPHPQPLRADRPLPPPLPVAPPRA